MEYAIEICGAVLDVWQPTPERKVVINLPSTVEMATPNVYADQIETVCDRIKYRDSVVISLHAHNDRGTAVAATELALMAGAERVEGTLFGNGERTGNADILTLGMNLYSQGIDPGLDFSRLDEMVALYEKSTNLAVHPRHPYAGALVYTAFSGSHQDAINKGLARMKERPEVWAVPYLPIDPKDVGRSYDPVIRINSQSGKGGVAYILEQTYGIQMPRGMQKHFGALVTELSDQNGKELLPEEIFAYFKEEYVRKTPMNLLRYNEKTNGETRIEARLLINGEEKDIVGTGNGIMDAFCKALGAEIGFAFEINEYREHSLEYSSRSRAITYVEISDHNDRKQYGAGVSSSISKSSLRAVVSAVNKML
jgi:2-isopropylmalate synthase